MFAPLPPFTISREDTLAFAELSGDYNPLHVDPIAARRFIFGRTVPHGIHVLLAGLERAFCEFHHVVRLCRLRVAFSRPARHAEPLAVHCSVRKAHELEFAILQDDSQLQKVALTFEEQRRASDLAIADTRYPARTPRALEFCDVPARSGATPLAVDRALLSSLFPVLARMLPASQLAVLLASTRIIGMECPGLRSVFLDLSIAFDPRPSENPADLAFDTMRADARTSLVRLKLTGACAQGEATALFRPDPVIQPGCAELASRVDAAEFSGQHALVVGGSRGLGEVAAKLLSMGGAQVAITFARGREDAERVAADIVSHGGQCSALHFDVLDPPAGLTPGQPPSGFRPTHLYYFATPSIQIVKGRSFNGSQFRHYCDYYVDGLSRTLQAVDRLFPVDDAPLTLLYPSTVFVDAPPPGAAEYAAAKAAGEVVARMLARTRASLRVLCPRLPALRTDQTSNVGARAAAEPVAVLLELLREIR